MRDKGSGLFVTPSQQRQRDLADAYRHEAAKLIGKEADGVYLFNVFTSREDRPRCLVVTAFDFARSSRQFLATQKHVVGVPFVPSPLFLKSTRGLAASDPGSF